MFGVANADLAVAVAKAGGFGDFDVFWSFHCSILTEYV